MTTKHAIKRPERRALISSNKTNSLIGRRNADLLKQPNQRLPPSRWPVAAGCSRGAAGRGPRNRARRRRAPAPRATRERLERSAGLVPWWCQWQCPRVRVRADQQSHAVLPGSGLRCPCRQRGQSGGADAAKTGLFGPPSPAVSSPRSRPHANPRPAIRWIPPSHSDPACCRIPSGLRISTSPIACMIGKPSIVYVGQWPFGPNDADRATDLITRFGLLVNSELF